MCRGIIAQQSPQRCGLTCQGRPASEDHEWIDAFTFANWTVDYLKYDNCQACKYGYGSTAYIMQVTRMGDALKATGKPIFYSTEMGGAAFGPDICNSARGISAQPQPHWVFTSEKNRSYRDCDRLGIEYRALNWLAGWLCLMMLTD